MDRSGFTLVELLAVIVILAIILAIAIPGISTIIDGSTRSSFASDAKMVIKGISYLTLDDPNYNVTSVNETNLESLTSVSVSNINTLKVTNVNGSIKVVIVGKNRWANLVAYGTSKNMLVAKSSDFAGFADNSGASEPELANNMIPVMYYNNNWVKADKDNLVGTYSWYDYGTKKWANAVTVTSSTLNTYQNASIGTIIPEADILTYLVWIPRYKYAIPTGSGARSINIMFEGKTIPKSSGTAVGTNYLTHTAFTFGDKELNGFWVGKFETTGTIGAITIKPNLQSLRNQTVSTFYNAIRNMEANGNAYSFDGNEVDTHMMLNSEWGAVTYLSTSTYGLNSEIYKNNSSGFYTGRSGGNVGGSQIKVYGTNEYADAGFYTYDGKCATTTTAVPGIDANCTTIGNTVSDTSLSYKASTTGTIYGIYDMSAGTNEYVMSNYNNYSGSSLTLNSGFNGLNGDGTTTTTGLPFPNDQYYNLYATSTATTACNGGICYGHALSETSGWYEDYPDMTTATLPWLVRGSNWGNTSSAGIFYYCPSNGTNNVNNGTRVTAALAY